MNQDVVIVGGGPAGLSAALTFGRGLEKVLLCDGGVPRNAAAEEVHNFVTRDGTQALETRREKPRRDEATLDGCAWARYPARQVTSPLPSHAALPADLADVRRKLEQLAAAGQLSELIELVLGLLIDLRDKNTALSAKLTSALRELYGRKSQKVSTEQLMLLFAELGAETPQGAAGPAPTSEPLAEAPPQPEQGLVPQPPEPPKPPPGRRGRSPLPAHLPRETRFVPVPEAERTCPQCGADKKCIGHRTREVLEFVPAQFRIIEEQREKLACPSCPEQGVTTADSEKVMDRGRPGPGLLANIIVEKFEDAMPLYRQAQQ